VVIVDTALSISSKVAVVRMILAERARVWECPLKSIQGATRLAAKSVHVSMGAYAI
jgi:hypothetical protein